MKYLLLIGLLLLAACTPPNITPITYTAPIPLAPDNVEFIDSDMVIEWQWSSLQANQVFALRVWYETETPQELWLADTQTNIQPMIDSYSQAVGTFYWQVAVVNLNSDGGFESLASEWSEVVTLHRVRRFTLEPLPVAEQSEMARYINSQEFESAFELANFTRDFIHHNTNITPQGDATYAGDFSDAAQLIFDYSQGAGEAPQLYCDGMSTAMLTVFREVGIESRLIFLYSEVSDWFSQHTFLEVFNPDTQQWEVHDSSYNLYFVDTVTGERASIERLVFGDLETLVGCTTDGTCSREALSDSVEKYLSAFRTGHVPDEVWINPNRLNISQRITGQENNNFPEFVARMTGHAQRNLIFRFDSWETLATEETD
jgi:hypothetical protein